MGKKVFITDVSICNGCRNCQVSCKDEHCDTSWLPYAAPQPPLGQFWCKVNETTRGSVPKVKLTYTRVSCMHCDDCPLVKIAPEAVYQREDGLVIIDPEKAKGNKRLVDACPYNAVFWNEELELPQKCTGCAHLIDDGWEVPRCVDACPTKAIKWVDEDEAASILANAKPCGEVFPNFGTKPRLHYINVPKRFVAGEIYDEDADEVIIGAKLTLTGADGSVQTTQTDEFGDFWFNDVDAQTYTVAIENEGYYTRVIETDATDEDQNIGPVALYKAR